VRCPRSWPQTFVGSITLSTSISALALLCCVAPICLSSPGDLPQVSFEEHEAEQFARSLLEEHRYAEAISYLKRELKTIPAGTTRLNMLLLLADCQLEIADLSGTLGTLTEAESLAVEPSAVRAVAERNKRLAELQTLLPHPFWPEGTLDAQEIAQDRAELEKPPQVLVTNSFFETDLRQVLTDLSMETGVPIIWDTTVEGLVTYEATNQLLEQVLKAVLLPAGYTYSLQDGIYYVGSPGPGDPAFGLLSQTVVVTLSNIEASEAMSLLSDYFKPFVNASTKANMVCITAPPATLERILQDLEALDQPPLQILIEVVVAEISADALRKMGLDWQFSHSTDKSSWEVGTDHTDIPGAALLGKYGELGLDIGEHAVDLATSLEMLLETADAKIRANPRITTLNGRTAEISLTKDQYFIIATSVSQYYQYNTLQSISSGIKLEITPYASALGTITVYVKPEVGDVIGSGAEGLPEITKRTASTSVRVKDGETFVIGGLNIQNEKIRRKKVPLLGSIPLLGYLFRYDERRISDTEIVIFVTPRIVGG
jgi:type II secretory pathway component GspD/PulD (secretin)